ncbi:hypothetical protein SCOCK_300113 [Actinacidiphila cocklensis]|uniref:Uncharacterized protein n=1 Tax=Actinacidiphila cocklensis TaxID=887465 RepID=A0A9W4GRZ7_9ACTN|nr:hypothetical protein SCOCK_300113 [Actinacidiphila cocklensis]
MKSGRRCFVLGSSPTGWITDDTMYAGASSPSGPWSANRTLAPAGTWTAYSSVPRDDEELTAVPGNSRPVPLGSKSLGQAAQAHRRCNITAAATTWPDPPINELQLPWPSATELICPITFTWVDVLTPDRTLGLNTEPYKTPDGK